MDRRSFIGSIGTVSVVGLAGCMDSETPEGEEGTPDDSNSDGEGDTSDPNEEPPEATPEELSLTVTDHSFTVVPESSVPTEPEVLSHKDNNVSIGGTVRVSNGCMSAELVSAPVQGDSDPLTVMARVAGYEKQTEDACTQAIKTVAFELEFTYDGDAPEEVVVDLDGVDSHTHTLPVGGEE